MTTQTNTTRMRSRFRLGTVYWVTFPELRRDCLRREWTLVLRLPLRLWRSTESYQILN